jgi:2-alkyl-3-oxoalkanoate reductase
MMHDGHHVINVSPTAQQQVLVTGGGGFLGKAIARLLINRGDRVISFSRGIYPELETMGVTQIQGDISDPVAVHHAMQGADAVYHVAAKAGVWGDYREFYRINTEGTRHVIAACKANKVDRLIFTSSPSVILDGTDMEGVDESVGYPDKYDAPYPESKTLAEQEVRQAGAEMKTICLRPHLIWGPGDNHLVPRILQRAKRLRRVGDGRNRVDVTYIDNAACAHLLAEAALIRNPDLSGNVYFISQGKPVLLWEMVDNILKAGGLQPVKRMISVQSAIRIGGFLEWIYRLFGIQSEPQMTRFVARELSTSHWFDIRAAERDLGYVPEVSMEEGLERLADYLRGPGTVNNPT